MSVETPFNPEDFSKTVENFDKTSEIGYRTQSNKSRENNETNDDERVINEAFELAKVQLHLTETVAQAQEIIRQYYEKLKKYEDGKKRFEEKTAPYVFILDKKPYSLIKAIGGMNRLRLRLLPDFSVGDSVNVKRSSGEMDWGWRVAKISADAKALIEKRLDDRTLRKTVNLEELHSWNNERIA